MTTIVTIDMGGTGATHAAGAREALSVPSMTDMGQSYAQANSARDQANTARGNANDAYSQANTAYSQANSARDQANTAYGQANSARSDANTTFATINTTFGTVNTNYQAAYAQANTARTTANDAYGAANTKLASAGGTLSGDLIITGNLTVSGNQTILNTEVLTTEDADIILLSNTSSTPALNAGLIINRGTSTNTFLRWDEATDKWGWSDSGTTTYYFEDLRQGLSTTNTTFATINTSLGTINTSYQAAYSQANTAGTNSLNAYGQANAAYSQANSAYGAANNRVLKAGDTMTGQLNISSGGLLVTGNVGIGTTSPIFPLQVKTNTGTPPQALQLNTTDWTTTIGSAFQFGQLNISSGGLLVTGNVGIGTTTPGNALHVVGSANVTSSVFIGSDGVRLSSDGAGELGVGYGQTATNRKFSVYNNTTLAFTVTPTGNVGIGTSSPGLFNLYAGAYTVSGANYYASTRGASRIGMHDNAINFYTANAASAGHSTGTAVTWYQTLQSHNSYFIVYTNTITTAITILANGNVGIGTTTPSQKLHVDGGSALIANGSSNTALWLGNSAYGFELEYSTGKIHTTINSAKRVTVDNSGNVGIGVTTPQRKLDVFGSGILASFGSQMGVNSIAGIHFGYSESSSNVDTYKKSAMVFERTDNHNQGGNASGKIHFLLHNSGSTSASGITIKADGGNVGIGTTSPSNKLHVYGSIRAGIAGNSNANYAALEVASSGTADSQAAIAIQQVTSEGDTIIFADYEPFVEWGISTENGSNLIQFTAGSGTNSLGSKTVYNRSGDARTAHTKFQVNLSDGSTIVGGNVGIGTSSPATKLNVLVGAGGANGTAGIRVGGVSNYESLELGILDNYGAMFRSYGNDMHYYSGHWRTVGTGASEDHAHYWYTSKTGSANWSTAKLILDADGALKPGADNTYNLGTSSLRWANIYTADLNMSNKGSQNDIDGTWGEWTIQEGEEDLFLLNRRNGKKYKFLLKEIE